MQRTRGLSPTSAVAVPLVSWSISGPGTILATQLTATDWALAYSLKPAGFSTQTWTATATAPVTGDYEFAWNYSGFHAFFQVTAFLNTFDPSSTLINAGPTNCCSSPSNGFNYTGDYTFTNVLAGNTFGFTFGGHNLDSNNVLSGTLNLDQVAVPEPASLALLGLGLAGLGFARRKKA